jgi:hypothetical protein
MSNNDDDCEYEQCIYNAMQRLKDGDPTLVAIVTHDYYKSTEMLALAQALLEYPNKIRHLEISGTAMGCRGARVLAQYIASSDTIEFVSTQCTMIGTNGHIAIAKALHANTSLKLLYLGENKRCDMARIEVAFVCALRVNPDRPKAWHIHYGRDWHWSRRILAPAAAQMGAPSMLDQLHCCDRPPRSRRRAK